MVRFYYYVFSLLCLGLVILPIFPIPDLAFQYNGKRIFQIGLLLAGVIVFVFSSRQQLQSFCSRLNGYFFLGTAIVLVLSLISSVTAFFPFYAFVELSLLILLLLFVVSIGELVEKNELIIYTAFITASVFVAIYFIKFGLSYIHFLINEYSFWLWPGKALEGELVGFSNIRFFNQVQSFTLPLLIGSTFFTFERNKLLGCLLVLLSIVWWMLLIQSAGRGIILSVLTAALFALIFFQDNTHKWMWYFLICLVLGFTAKFILFDVIPDIGDQTKSVLRGGGSGRLTLWPNVLMGSLERPLLGHGPMSFANVNTEFYRGHPHNSILQLFYEFGYPATLIILTGTYYGIKNWIYQSKKVFENLKGKALEKQTVIRVSLTVALFGGVLYSQFSGVIVMPLSQLWFAVVIGLMIGIYAKETKKRKRYHFNNYTFFATKLVVLLASAMLIVLLVKDVPTLSQNERKYVEETDRATIRPRLWQQGKIGLKYYSEMGKSQN